MYSSAPAPIPRTQFLASASVESSSTGIWAVAGELLSSLRKSSPSPSGSRISRTIRTEPSRASASLALRRSAHRTVSKPADWRASPFSTTAAAVSSHEDSMPRMRTTLTVPPLQQRQGHGGISAQPGGRFQIAEELGFKRAGGDFHGAGRDFLLAGPPETQLAKPHRPIAHAHGRAEDSTSDGARRGESAGRA